MRHLIATAMLALTFACTGGGHSTPKPVPPKPPDPVTTAPIPSGTYRARVNTGAAQAAAVGTITPTLIMQGDGNGRLELDGWQHVRSAIYADAQGDLQISPDATLTNAAGATVPLTLSGTLTNGRLVGTCNGGAFDLTLIPETPAPQDLTSKVGTYLSTASSNGQTIRLTIAASGAIAGEAYASPADAEAHTNLVCRYTGTLGYGDGDPTKTHNTWNIGFQMILINPDGTRNYLPGGTSGLATFAPDGSFVALTANHNNSNLGSGQLSATFTKE